jgi:hypothetical protein
MKRRWQLRDQDFGLCIIEADSAAAALDEFLRIKGRRCVEAGRLQGRRVR